MGDRLLLETSDTLLLETGGTDDLLLEDGGPSDPEGAVVGSRLVGDGILLCGLLVR